MGRRFKAQFNKRPVSGEHWPCDDIRPGDGCDPRYDSKDRKTSNRKALQLCEQVMHTLSLTLGECADETIRNLQVLSVQPAPDSTQLLVVLSGTDDPDKAYQHLVNASGLLRSAVGRGINRKRVPNLRFQVVL